MRKIIIILLALVPLGAAAQNRAIEELSTRYSNRNGFSTTVIKGELSKGFAGSMNIEGVDISNIMNNISAIIVIRADYQDNTFAQEVRQAVAEGYRTIVSSSSDGEIVKLLLSENQDRKNELVIAITGPETNLLISVTGDYKLGKVTKIDQ